MTNEMKSVFSSPAIIKVLKMEYWDGSKYMARLDKPDTPQVLRNIQAVMKARFLSLPHLEQRKLPFNWSHKKGQMVNRKIVRMTEAEYNKSDKLKD